MTTLFCDLTYLFEKKTGVLQARSGAPAAVRSDQTSAGLDVKERYNASQNLGSTFGKMTPNGRPTCLKADRALFLLYNTNKSIQSTAPPLCRRPHAVYSSAGHGW